MGNSNILLYIAFPSPWVYKHVNEIKKIADSFVRLKMHKGSDVFACDQWTSRGQEAEHGVNVVHAGSEGFINEDRSHLLQFKPLV